MAALVITAEDARRIIEAMPVDEVYVDHDLLAMYRDPQTVSRTLMLLLEPFMSDGVTAIVGTESRGFLLGGMAAQILEVGFVAVRKEGRYLPGKKYRKLSAADWEGKRTIFEIQASALTPADRVLVIDDWYTTGSQAGATLALIRETGATPVGASVIVEEGTDPMANDLGKFHALLNWCEQRKTFLVSDHNLSPISPCLDAKLNRTGSLC